MALRIAEEETTCSASGGSRPDSTRLGLTIMQRARIREDVGLRCFMSDTRWTVLPPFFPFELNPY